MNKPQMVEIVAKDTGLTQSKVNEVLDALLGRICKTLHKREDVQFKGFGLFSVHEAPARKGTNPSNGQPIDIAASSQVKFKAGNMLKEAVKLF